MAELRELVEHAVADQKRRAFAEQLNSNLLKIALIGAPNVGKSTLFNALMRDRRRESVSENGIFSTIDPFIGTFAPQDERMDFFRAVAADESLSLLPTLCTVIDTPAIAPGSFREKTGVGMAWAESLSHCDALCVVLGCTEGDELVRYREEFNPLQDLIDIEQELMLRDLYKIEKQLIEMEHIMHMDDSCANSEHWKLLYETYLKAWKHIAGEERPTPPPKSRFKASKSLYRTKMPKTCTGKLIRLGKLNFPEREILREFDLLTTKEMIYLPNQSSMDYHRRRVSPAIAAVQSYLSDRDDPAAELLWFSGDFERKMLSLYYDEGDDAVREYFEAHPTHHAISPRLFRQLARSLEFVQYYTHEQGPGENEKTLRAWIIREGSSAIDAAHRKDALVAKYFIRMEVVSFEDYHAANGDKLALKMEGKLRVEGRRYAINDGDIVEFFHNNANKR